MNNENRRVIDVPISKLIIHPLAQSAFECDRDLIRQCNQKVDSSLCPPSGLLEYPKVIRADQYYQAVSGWSQLLNCPESNDLSLSVVCIERLDTTEIEYSAWAYVISRLLTQVNHSTYCAQLLRVFEDSPLSHSDIEALTGVSAKTRFAIARKLSHTSLSSSKRQISRLEKDTAEGAWL